MDNSADVVTRFFKRFFALAMKNPRTTAAGIVAIIGGSKLVWNGQIESGVVAVLTGLVGVLGADAVTVARNEQKIEENSAK
jgi:hypothetical protein